MSTLVSPDHLRVRFCVAMSAMYRAEVPLYGSLLDIVAEVNARCGGEAASDTRLAEERHGAIRVGTAGELCAMRRFFAVLGMEPVGYYDLTVAGIPVHSTAFRPVTAAALAASPFRMFCSLLRLEMVEDAALRKEAAAILAGRQIVSDRLAALIDKAEAQGGLEETDADDFLREGLELFRWQPEARVDAQTYRRLLDAHRLVADVVSFAGPHINHLTPRTLDIDAAQAEMERRGIDAKAVIEGPPRRRCPILLRQTSFKALSENIAFGGEKGEHTARFGEIEQRGAALTRKGRALYDQCLYEAQAAGLAEAFRPFPDDWNAMRREGLAYFRDTKTGREPILYEDFLPVSAAGIFRSNLGSGEERTSSGHAAQGEFEKALGRKVLDPFKLYEAEAG